MFKCHQGSSVAKWPKTQVYRSQCLQQTVFTARHLQSKLLNEGLLVAILMDIEQLEMDLCQTQ